MVVEHSSLLAIKTDLVSVGIARCSVRMNSGSCRSIGCSCTLSSGIDFLHLL